LPVFEELVLQGEQALAELRFLALVFAFFEPVAYFRGFEHGPSLVEGPTVPPGGSRGARRLAESVVGFVQKVRHVLDLERSPAELERGAPARDPLANVLEGARRSLRPPVDALAVALAAALLIKGAAAREVG